jgi:alpha-amylase
VALDQFEMYAPEVLDSFRELAETGSVEFLAETDAHSLASLKSKNEFVRQVESHVAKIEKYFGQKPVTFRNTELIYSDEIGEMVADMGFQTMLTEGAKHVLGWKSPNFMYTNSRNPKLKILLRNFRLSDDIAFRFSDRGWSEWPLNTNKFIKWLKVIDPKQEVVNLFMDYETFGEHQWEDTGIFDFFKALPAKIFSETDFKLRTPKELAKELQPAAAIYVPYPISWADEERDLTAWVGNELQDDAFDNLYSLEEKIRFIDDPQINKDWKYLQSSDHFYYMCTKWFSDGDVHKYFNPFGTPYDAYINYMNVFSDFLQRVEEASANRGYAKFKEYAGEVGKEIRDQAGRFSDAAEDTFKKAKAKAKEKWDSSSIKDIKIEDIAEMSNAKIKELVKKVEMSDLVHAVKDAGEDVRDRIIPNLGKKAKKKYEELEAEVKKIKKSDIDRYRKNVEKEIRNVFKKK